MTWARARPSSTRSTSLAVASRPRDGIASPPRARRRRAGAGAAPGCRPRSGGRRRPSRARRARRDSRCRRSAPPPCPRARRPWRRSGPRDSGRWRRRRARRRAALEGDAAVAAEDCEAAAAALPVALVGGGEPVGAEPLHRVGLARDAGWRLSVKSSAPSSVRSTPSRSTAPAEKCASTRAVAAEDGDVVVLLQGHGDLAVGVDVDELGLGVVRRDLGEAGEVGADDGVALHGAVRERHDRQPAGGELREGAVVHLLVALVLDRDRDEAAVGGERRSSRAGRRGRRRRSRRGWRGRRRRGGRRAR